MAARKITFASLALAGYMATIPAANLLIQHLGPVPVGFGLIAPAGVYAAGVSLALRDAVHETAGRAWVLVALACGVGLSWLLAAPQLAAASAVAFGLSELADFAVYTPLRERGRELAVLASGAVGLVVDSVLFLWLAFQSLDFLPGQLVGKAWMTALAALTVWAWRRRKVVAA